MLLQGKLTIWSIAKIFESIRYSVLTNGFGHFDRLKDKDHSIFLANVTYDMSNIVNQLTAKTHWGVNYPLYVKLNIVYIGTSAFAFDCNVYEHSTGEKLMVGYFTFVYVDYKTRKSATLPPWMMEIKTSKQFNAPQKRLPTLKIPTDAFTYYTKAFSSDIDMNGHVNQSIFLKWCADAGADAALKGHYYGFTEDIGIYSIDQMSLRYIGEGMQNDKFVVYTWQDERCPKIIHFAIKKEGKVVFVARFKYHSNDFQAKL